MKNIKEIGSLLKDARKKKDLTIEKVYKLTRIHPNVLKALENGDTGALFNKVYAKAFLRKYTEFLGLDRNALVDKFASLYPDTQTEKSIPAKKEDISPHKSTLLKMALSVVIVGIFIFFTCLTLLNIKSFLSKLSQRKPAPASVKVVKKTIKKEKVKKIRSKSKKSSKTLFPIPESSSIILGVSSTEKVWMRVKVDGKVLFSGILPKDSKESWTGNKNFSLRVGKLEALKFAINDKEIGNLGKGVQNIYIDRNKIIVGKKKIRGG